MRNLSLGKLAIFGLILYFGGAANLEAKVLEARLYRWWGGAPACLDIPGGDASPGQRIQLYPCHNQPNQNWLYDEERGFLRSYKNNVCIDLDDGVIEEGRTVGLWNCWDGDPQKFRYDAEAALLRYRRDENFCIALNDDLKGLHLARCTEGNVFQTFDLKHGFGDRRMDEVTWVTTHNAHVSSGEASWFAPNQSRSIRDQLNDGVRGFMLDTYSRDGDVALCHGDCNGFPGFGYASPRQNLGQVFRTLNDYMREYPDTIVTLFLEDYANEGDMRRVLDANPGLKAMLLNPYEERVRDRGWPTLNDMIARNKRLLIISDKDNKRGLGIGFSRDFTVENYWSLGALGNNTECKKRWDDIPLDTNYGPMEPLFVMNQFRDIPTGLTAGIDNKPSTLMGRIEDKCLPTAKRRPNYLAVDFYEAAGFGVFKVAEQLNQAVAALFQDDQYRGHAQIIQPGEYNTDHLGVGNDKTTSIMIFGRGSIEVFEHDGFQNRIGTFDRSAPNLGNELNDRISSVRAYFK